MGPLRPAFVPNQSYTKSFEADGFGALNQDLLKNRASALMSTCEGWHHFPGRMVPPTLLPPYGWEFDRPLTVYPTHDFSPTPWKSDGESDA